MSDLDLSISNLLRQILLHDPAQARTYCRATRELKQAVITNFDALEEAMEFADGNRDVVGLFTSPADWTLSRRSQATASTVSSNLLRVRMQGGGAALQTTVALRPGSYAFEAWVKGPPVIETGSLIAASGKNIAPVLIVPDGNWQRIHLPITVSNDIAGSLIDAKRTILQIGITNVTGFLWLNTGKNQAASDPTKNLMPSAFS